MMIKNLLFSRTGIAITACLILLISMPSPAKEFHSLASIRMQVESFIMQYSYASPYPPRVQLGNLDSRLRLKACPEQLSIEFARRNMVSGNTAILVRCEQKSGWKIHLPVSIDVFDDVLVAAKPLLKGQYIDNSAVRFQKHNIARLKNGYYSRDSNLDQLAARRNLVPGTVLTSANVSPRLLVRSGQQVTLVLDYNGLQIRSSGEALRSASLGEVVRVRNSQSRKVVEGIVSGEGQVRINL
jgi:flagella basal body P-ring formation protein FlgA